MSNLLQQLRAVASELRRRKVVQVVLAYLVASAAIIGVVADVEQALELPAHTLTLVVLLLAAGLPVAALLAWMYELVPDTGAGAAQQDPAAPARPAAETGTVPAPIAAFIGRAAELAELTRLLQGDGCRLVTVAGPGGIGKTRLAVEAASRVEAAFRDGVIFVPLGGVEDPALLPQALAEALGVPLSRRDDPFGEVLDYLRGKELLLLLDNFEQLLPAAECVDLLLRAAPAVRVLATSRERLHLPAETLLPLAGLTLEPQPGDEAGDALHLFIAVARRQDPRFELDAQSARCARRLCELLAGVPLAIELAAAWTRLLSCGEILEEVQRDLDILAADPASPSGRQRSLGATFDASWRLLADGERRALARLAVFVSPFERDAAAAVAEADLPLLRALVDKSFLTPSAGRFHMLHVIRQYALRRLDPADARATRDRHVAWVAGWLRGLEPQLLRSEPEAVNRVAQAIAEVRAAWAHACEVRDVTALLPGLDGLFHFYEARGWSREGADAFARALAAAGDAPEADARRLRGRLAVRCGALLERLGDLKDADRLLREGLAVAEEFDDAREVAFTLHRLGRTCSAAGGYDEAAGHHARARALYEKLADRHGLGWSIAYLGNIALNRGEHDLAAQLYTDALRILREEHDRNGMCATLNNLGYIAIRHRRYDEARRNLGEALSLQAVLGNHRSAAYLLNNLGYAAREAGDYEESVRHFEEAQVIAERLGYRGITAASLTGLAALYVATGELDRAAPLLHRALAIASELGDHRVASEALLTLARLYMRTGARDGAGLARFVARHPATPADTRDEAVELLQAHGDPRPEPAPAGSDDLQIAELDDVIADVLSATAAPGTTDGAARRRPTVNLEKG